MLKYMLDTDICIYTIKRKPAHLKRLFNAHIGQLCISSVTWGELIRGAEKSQQVAHNLAVIEGFAARLEILDFDRSAAQHFGEIRANLEKRGTPIGGYDVMIAGHARSSGLILVTNNEAEFNRVEGLRVQNWLTES